VEEVVLVPAPERFFLAALAGVVEAVSGILAYGFQQAVASLAVLVLLVDDQILVH